MSTSPITAVRRADRRVRRAQLDLVAAILAARASGQTLQSIADATGLTRQRIHQITKS